MHCTCTVTRTENLGIAKAFGERHPELRRIPLRGVNPLALLPHREGTDELFACTLVSELSPSDARVIARLAEEATLNRALVLLCLLAGCSLGEREEGPVDAAAHDAAAHDAGAMAPEDAAAGLDAAPGPVDSGEAPGFDAAVPPDGGRPPRPDASVKPDTGYAPGLDASIRPDASLPDAGALPADAGGTGPVLSAGCGKAGAATGELSFTVPIEGVSRTYEVLVPGSYNPSTPLAIVFVFHGAGGSIDPSAMGLQTVNAASAGAIYVVPQGILLKGYESYGNGWNQTCGSYDMTFFDTMLAAVTSKYCVDLNRLFVTGFSWGADMTDALACCKGQQIRAVAPASGDEIDWNHSCPATATPAFRLTYADNDAYTQAQFDKSITYFRTALHCSTQTSPVTPSPCVGYQGCDKPVISCMYHGMGHATPADWATATWSFFSSFK